MIHKEVGGDRAEFNLGSITAEIDTKGLELVLRELKESFEIQTDEIVRAIETLSAGLPVTSAQSPIEITIPEIKIPEIKAPDVHVEVVAEEKTHWLIYYLLLAPLLAEIVRYLLQRG